MTDPLHTPEQNHLRDELDAAQKNILPHDVLRNDRSVDDGLWNGFERPSGVQKAGLIIWGTFFIIGAVSLASYIKSSNKGTFIGIVPTLLFLIAGVRIFSNAFRRRTK